MIVEKEEKKSEKKIQDKFAVIRTGSKQYFVKEGTWVEVDLLDVKDGERITFDEVLLVVDDGKVNIGTPLIEKAKVVATVLGLEKGDKQVIFKYKAKKNYRVKTGHRQKYTKVKIDKIENK